jgi:hypothetical protein
VFPFPSSGPLSIISVMWTLFSCSPPFLTYPLLTSACL